MSKISFVDAIEKMTNKIKEEIGADALSEVNDAVAVFEDNSTIDIAVIGGKPYEFEEELDIFEDLPESEDIANG